MAAETLCSRWIQVSREYLENGNLHLEEILGLSKALSTQCVKSTVADACLNSELMPTILQTVQYYSQLRRLDTDSPDLSRYIQSVCILFANFSSCGVLYCEHLLVTCLPRLEDLIVAGISHPKRNAFAACLSLLCNLLRADADKHALLNVRSLWCQVLLGLMPSFTPSSSEPPPPDPAEEWSHILVYTLARQRLLGPLLTSLATHSPSSVSHEQLILLTLCDQLFLDTGLHEELQTALLGDAEAEQTLVTFAQTVLAMLSTPATLDAADPLAPSTLSISTRLIGTILAFASASTRLKEALLEVIPVCDAWLRCLRPPPSRLPPGAAPLPSEPLLALFSAPERRDLIKDLLCLVCNLCYRCEAAQDALLDSGCLVTALAFCGTDFENPLSREWALLAVRNACEGNARCQAFVQSLQPQQVLQDEALVAQGISVELDPSSGRFKFNHKPT